jgi:GNAT superfamily N-acetyltransferase
MTDVRLAGATDVNGVAGALARAFDDDPVMRWLMCEDDKRRAARMTRFFASEAHRHLGHDGVYTVQDHGGAALWAPPGKWKTTWSEMLRGAPTMLPVFNWRLPRGLRLMNAMEREHPRTPHWYLAILGTDPRAQGKGTGSALVRHILDRCDNDGLGAYLESSKESNIPYYERFGFRVTGEVTMGNGGPTLWPMWRDPDV